MKLEPGWKIHLKIPGIISSRGADFANSSMESNQRISSIAMLNTRGSGRTANSSNFVGIVPILRKLSRVPTTLRRDSECPASTLHYIPLKL
jgi:hypothetical protein